METNSILAVNSLDRYITSANGQQNQPLANALIQQFEDGNPINSGLPACNNFSITSPGALIYGYINKITIADIQLQWNVPTIAPGVNDQLGIAYFYGEEIIALTLKIPYGWYTPSELAAVTQAIFRNTDIGLIDPGFTVTYNSNGSGFVFTTTLLPESFQFQFLSLAQLAAPFSSGGLNLNDSEIAVVLKTYRIYGITQGNTALDSIQISRAPANFLYTSFIDIISETLTKYQKIKDTDTSAKKQNGIIARIYLAGQSTPQYLTNGIYGMGSTDDILGSRPFVFTQSTPNAKVIRWSKDEAVNSIDFQLRDQYGDLLFCNYAQSFSEIFQFSTEFQMTLLCTEGEM